MNEQEINEHNALAWLNLTDYELIERSASLDLPGELHPDPNTHGAVAATPGDVKQARKAADDHARSHIGDKFVREWIKENRK